MKKTLAVVTFAALVVALPSLGGERVVCKVWLDDGGVAARSTAPTPADYITDSGRPDTAGLATATLDGFACPSSKLQPDGGIAAWDGGNGFEITLITGAASTGTAGCPACDFRGATSVAMQCSAPVYYSEKWNGTVDKWNQRGVTAATSSDVLVDFTVNPNAYRIDFRGSGATNHVSVKPVSASASTFCTFSTIQRKIP